MNVHHSAEESQTSAIVSPELEPTDAQLLTQFVKRGDQAAFENLLHRHGPMVFGICRRVLKRHHEAEDAFQATFLSLAQDAAQIARPEMLANWLYTVARYAALKVKKEASQRQRIAQQLAEQMDTISESRPDHQELWSDLAPVLDLEMGRLADELRITVILCDVEGKTRKQAARELGWPEATVSTRLMKARALLAQRLKHHGVVLSAATLCLLLSQNAASAAVPTSLLAATLQTANVVSVGQSVSVGITSTKAAALAQGSAKSMMFVNLKTAVAALITLTTVGLGLQIQTTTQKDEPNAAPPAQAAIGQLASPFAEIAAVYRKNYDSIKSLKIEYTQREEDLIDSEVIRKSWKLFPPMPGENLTTLVIDRDKVHFKYWDEAKDHNTIEALIRKKHPDRFGSDGIPDFSRISAQDYLDQIPNVPFETHERISIYDGELYRDNNHGSPIGGMFDDSRIRPVHRISGPSESVQMFLTPNYLDWCLLGITGAKLPSTHKWRQQFRLPDLLASGKWSVVAEHELVDGADCLVIQSAESDKYWLDPQAGFAVRRWIKGGIAYKMELECRDLQHEIGDLWIPRTIVRTDYANDHMPKEYRGQPARRTSYELKQIELNQPIGGEYFQLVPPAGAVVFDSTLQPLDASGNPIENKTLNGQPQVITYIQPGDPADIPKTIEQAQKGTFSPSQQATGVSAQARTSSAFRWFIMANIVLLLAGGYFLWRGRSQ